MSKLAASLLGANALRLGEEARRAGDSGCDALHFDIMDGVFVPNLSFGPHIQAALRGTVAAFFDTHLMLRDPLSYVDVFAQSGSDAITVHFEAEHFAESLARVRELGLKVGASLRPGTPAEVLAPFFHRLDLILVMTVEPGFGGQKLMADQVEKIARLRRLGFSGEISVDGGVTLANAPMLASAGADMLVMGTSFFTAENPREVADAIHRL